MKKSKANAIWEGCDPSVLEAIRQFQNRWRYPIVRLIQELIDPAVASYTATLPSRYLVYIPGAARGMALSEMIRLNGLDATVHTLQTSVVEFFFTEAGQDARDKCFETTLEALIELIGDCARKRPTKSILRVTPRADLIRTRERCP